MNQEKIGKFIAKCRKEKNLTQQELADRLNITDRAVSNWENGRRMPDVSFYKELCEILDISINDLLNGEKINKDKIVQKSEEAIISALESNKRIKTKSKLVIGGLILLSIILLLLLIFTNPKIKIYTIEAQPTDNYSEKEPIITDTIRYNGQTVYFYDIDSLEICEKNNKCFDLKSALYSNQTDFKKIKDYLLEQYRLDNIESSELNDGGTTIFKSKAYSFIFCNTIDGNKDIYIGLPNMIDKLNGNFCSHTNHIKKFIRTYHVENISESNNATINVTLNQNHIVNILNTYNVIPGHTYEFTFYTTEYFDDTIENIFNYSVLYDVKEVWKNPEEYINDDIYVSIINNKQPELFELGNVYMTLKVDTLSSTGVKVIIDDYSNNKYSYSDYYRIDTYVNGTWTEVNKINNIGFNAIAYRPDNLGKLMFDLNWKNVYGELSKGKYRIVKEAMSSDEQCSKVDCDKKYISVEFRL